MVVVVAAVGDGDIALFYGTGGKVGDGESSDVGGGGGQLGAVGGDAPVKLTLAELAGHDGGGGAGDIGLVQNVGEAVAAPTDLEGIGVDAVGLVYCPSKCDVVVTEDLSVGGSDKVRLGGRVTDNVVERAGGAFQAVAVVDTDSVPVTRSLA